MSLNESRAIVVGAGVVGLCAAYYMAKRGQRVTIIDKAGLAGIGASRGNAGIIALGHPPLPRPGLIWKTIKWMLNRGSPLYVPPRLDPALIAWMWQFRSACTPGHFNHCMKILAEFGWETGKCWDQIVADEKIECEYNTAGWIDVFRTHEGMEHGLKEAELLRQYGFEVNAISGDDLRRREPAFRDSIVGAAHYADSRFAHPDKFCREMIDRVQRLDVEILAETEVSRIEINHDRFTGVELGDGRRVSAQTLVLAAGAWTTPLAKSIGVKVPLQAGKGYHVMLTQPQPCPTIACVLNETFVAVTPMGGQLRLAGTVELSGINDRLVRRRVEMLAAGARQYLHGIDQCEVTSSWCGLRPCTADGLPVIGWAPGVAGVFIATGHAKYGFAYGPITGRLACECILDGAPSLDIGCMSVDRFVRGRRQAVRSTSAPMPAAPSTT